MSNKHENLTSLFTSIANAIREKTGGTATLIADNFPDAIKAIEVLDTSDANAIAEDILKDKTAYVNGIKIVGTRIEINEEELRKYYVGIIEPDNSFGQDGDLYLVKG